MLKRLWNIFYKHAFWLLALAISNVGFGIYLWLMDAGKFYKLLCMMLLGTFGLYTISITILYKREHKKDQMIRTFVENPELSIEEQVIGIVKGNEKDQIRILGNYLRKKEENQKEQEIYIQEYEDYIESWAHEIKNPLALMTFVLDNRKEEISPMVYQRLEYARNQMQEQIEKMLYYARIKSPTQDYLFETVSLQECILEVLEEYRVLLQERKFIVQNKVSDIQVLSDRKGLIFMISQVVSNAIKYAKEEEKTPLLHLFTDVEKEFGYIRLGIRDYGVGVAGYDLPFIFDKGFTGENGKQRKTATGMGLYLVKQVAEDLKIEVYVKEEYTEGLEIHFMFPVV